MLMYHMTQEKNFNSILSKGIVPHMGMVYLCETPEDCLKLMGFRMMAEGGTWYCLAVEVSLLDIEESFDHDERFFGGAKAYVANKKLKPILEKSKKYVLGEYE